LHLEKKGEQIMKISKIIAAFISLITLFAINGILNNAAAQKPLPKCRASANQIYYVDSGQSVTEVRPGSNGGNGYQLNIIGTGADKFFIVKEPYMTSVSVIPGYTNSSQAKWQIFFNPRMGQELTNVRMQSECTGRVVHEHQLTVKVRLLDQ
jgi:hypothetical protein